MAYLSAGFLPYVRPYAPPAVSRGAELLVATKILAKERMDALLVFQKEIVEPELTNNSELAALKGTLESLDDAGLFTRVFLRELSMYGQKLAGSTPSKSDWMPIQKLIEMLTTLVTKTPGEDTERDFAVNTPQLSICVVLVGKAFTLLTRGTEPHVSYTNRKASSGIAQFYILARGENAKFGKEVVQKLIQTRSYEKDYEESFRTSARTQAQYIGALHIVKPSSEGP
jgi:small subunit ribosomal protein S1